MKKLISGTYILLSCASAIGADDAAKGLNLSAPETSLKQERYESRSSQLAKGLGYATATIASGIAIVWLMRNLIANVSKVNKITELYNLSKRKRERLVQCGKTYDDQDEIDREFYNDRIGEAWQGEITRWLLVTLGSGFTGYIVYFNRQYQVPQNAFAYFKKAIS